MTSITYKANRRNQKFKKGSDIRKKFDSLLSGEVKQDLTKMFALRVANWKNRPRFFGRRTSTNNRISLFVHPGGDAEKVQIYSFVTEGTPPHVIRGAPLLVFVAGRYQRKTGPGGKYGGAGVVSGGEQVRAKQVNHPGYKGAGFEEAIAIEYKPTFVSKCERTLGEVFD